MNESLKIKSSILRYVCGEMTAAEKDAFEQRLQSDHNLKQDVEKISKINMTMDELRPFFNTTDQELAQHFLNDIDRDEANTGKVIRMPVRKGKMIQFGSLIAIAAAVAILIGIDMLLPTPFNYNPATISQSGEYRSRETTQAGQANLHISPDYPEQFHKALNKVYQKETGWFTFTAPAWTIDTEIQETPNGQIVLRPLMATPDQEDQKPVEMDFFYDSFDQLKADTKANAQRFVRQIIEQNND